MMIKSECPNIVFTLRDTLYTISSADVSTISQFSMPEPLPGAPNFIEGIIIYQGCIVPLLNLRTILAMPTLNDEYLKFCQMLEARKQDHINWVNALEDSILNKYDFELTTDPHKCTFGKWYDNYKSTNPTIEFHLNKIDDPHKKLHNAADDIANCDKRCAECKNEKCKKDIFFDVKNIYCEKVIALLDEAKLLFRRSYRAMTLVLSIDDKFYGLVVDDVLSVEQLVPINPSDEDNKYRQTDHITGVLKSVKHEKPVLELDYKGLLSALSFS